MTATAQMGLSSKKQLSMSQPLVKGLCWGRYRWRGRSGWFLQDLYQKEREKLTKRKIKRVQYTTHRGLNSKGAGRQRQAIGKEGQRVSSDQ